MAECKGVLFEILTAIKMEKPATFSFFQTKINVFPGTQITNRINNKDKLIF